ncbi:hypothetical protein ElyMa_000353100 [Elysia marginata]|uniref:IgGFc-binding protein N-terminal domain-containing protein n=1 Tax=Elysia marginata TaxID=1093978 RepID=A0AAV4FDE5_9GAST|nr:hypothetical protein ElyMa_000353100 [Elysia marginata]
MDFFPDTAAGPVTGESDTLDKPDWDDLEVTWGQGGAKSFMKQPRTVQEATDAGFVQVGSSVCGENGVYNGIAYVKDEDYSVTLLFDVNGFIAGIQHGIPKQDADTTGYPSEKIQPPMVLVEDRYVLTAYFTDPNTICSSGRTRSVFNVEGTGTDLWLQTGNTASEVTLIPYYQTGLNVTNWTEGKCFPTMGKHYWYNVTVDMDCDTFYPVFLLYNGGKLNSFGWALLTGLDSVNYEHPIIPALGVSA